MGLEELFCFALFSYGTLFSVLSGRYRRVDTLPCTAGVSHTGPCVQQRLLLPRPSPRGWRLRFSQVTRSLSTFEDVGQSHPV